MPCVEPWHAVAVEKQESTFRDVSCETTLTLQPGREYELGLSPSILTPPVVVAALVSGSFLNKARAALPVKSVCRVERMRTEEEDREATR